MCVMNLSAQHIKFLGIPLGQSLSVFNQQLKQKGFIQEFYGISTIMYSGTFWKSQADVLVYSERGNVVKIDVKMPASTNNPGIGYNELISSMTKKYGKCYERKNHHYTWKVNGGAICVDYTYFQGRVYQIQYYDKTSNYYSKKFGGRNYDDDL